MGDIDQLDKFGQERRFWMGLGAGVGAGALGALGGLAASELGLHANDASIIDVLKASGGSIVFPLTKMSLQAESPVSNKIKLSTPIVSVNPTPIGYEIVEPGRGDPTILLTSDWLLKPENNPGLEEDDLRYPRKLNPYARKLLESKGLVSYVKQKVANNTLTWGTRGRPDENQCNLSLANGATGGWGISMATQNVNGEGFYSHTPHTSMTIGSEDAKGFAYVSQLRGGNALRPWVILKETQAPRAPTPPQQKIESRYTIYPVSGGGPITLKDTGENFGSRMFTILGLPNRPLMELHWNGPFNMSSGMMADVSEIIAVEGEKDPSKILDTMAAINANRIPLDGLQRSIDSQLKKS